MRGEGWMRWLGLGEGMRRGWVDYCFCIYFLFFIFAGDGCSCGFWKAGGGGEVR